MLKFKNIKEKDLYFKTKKGYDTDKIERIKQLKIGIYNLDLFIITAYEKISELRNELSLLSFDYEIDTDNLKQEMEKNRQYTIYTKKTN